MNISVECPGRSAFQQNVIAAAEAFAYCEKLRGASILVTGATGLVGGAIVRTLLYLNREKGLNVKLLCPVRSMKKAETALKGVFVRRELNIFESDIEALPEIFGPVDYIIHCAAPTGSKHFITCPVETINAIVNGTRSMLSLAREKQVSGMVFLSSMEVYGTVTEEGEPRTETQLGQIDLGSVRSSYSEGKRLCELLCTCYAREYAVPVKTARLAQTFGAGVTEGENRVFMQFAKAALGGNDITLHTRGLSMGNYVHISDCVSALLTLLVCGEDGESYNVCGDDCHMTIRELAERTAALIGNGNSGVVTDIPETSPGYAPDTRLILDNSKLKALGWSPRFSVDDMILSLARDISEQKGRL